MANEAPPLRIIVNELLTSATHAINTGRAADDICLYLPNHYNDKEVTEAKRELESIGCTFPKISARTEKKKHVELIIKALIALDWKQKNITFAASDLNRVIYVPTTLDDEIQIRTEIASLQKKHNDLENFCKNMIDMLQIINDRVDNSSQLINHANTQLATITRQSPSPPAFQSFDPESGAAVIQSPSSSPLMSEVVKAGNTRDVQNITLSPSDPRTRLGITHVKVTRNKPPTGFSNDNRLRVPRGDKSRDEWQTVRSRATRRKLTVGTGQSSGIRAVKPVQFTSVFLTRCDNETEPGEVQSYLEEQNSWTIKEVVKLSTRNTSYASFRIDIKHSTESTTSDLLESQNWPPGTYVRKFHRERKLGAMKSTPSALQPDD